MTEFRPKLSWEVSSFSRGSEPNGLNRLSPEDAAKCCEIATGLLDEEAVVRNVDLSGTQGLILLWRGQEKIWVAVRKRLRPNEDLSELARVYSMVARGSDATVFTDAAAALLAGSRYWRNIYGFTPR
jgi:hypothetical protein